MHHSTDRITHTTAFVTPVLEHWLEREIAQWVRPMKDRSDNPSHYERTLLPRRYISLLSSTNEYPQRSGIRTTVGVKSYLQENYSQTYRVDEKTLRGLFWSSTQLTCLCAPKCLLWIDD